MRRLEESVEVVLGGMISRIRTVTTKSGRNAGSKMAILTFEDLSGSVEAVVFSEDLEKHRELVRPDAIVFLRGQVDRRREEPSLRVSEVLSFEEGPASLAEAVTIVLDADQQDPSTLQRLRDVCAAHSGDRPLYIHVRSADDMTTIVRCGSELCVRPDGDFVAEAGAVVGERSIKIIGGRRHITRRPDQVEGAPTGKAPAHAMAEA
jgi:DNA polymerase-3 subunit alpha